MPKLVINKLGPIEHIEMRFTDFMVFTGPQASGKSTLAKAIFFFRTIKEDMLSLITKKAALALNGEQKEKTITRLFEDTLREKFYNTFGSTWGMDNEMFIEYRYNDETYVKVELKDSINYSTPNYTYINYSENIKQFLRQADKGVVNKETLKSELAQLFSDEYETIYIPAGRSLITLLANQLNYIYSTMEDSQKRAIDFCTRSYIERILKIKPDFSNGIQGLLEIYHNKAWVNKDRLNTSTQLIYSILKGNYKFSSGEERLELDSTNYVKINFMSSGQQETLWILNLLYYYFVQGSKVSFIIEEPESHLFPEAQKNITELISLVNKAGYPVILTTHSPYILGSLNNLIYAESIGSIDAELDSKADRIISKHCWIDHKTVSSYFFKDGKAIDAMDEEIHQIENELIDDISSVINDDYEKLLELKVLHEEEEL